MELGELLTTIKPSNYICIYVFKKSLYQGDVSNLLKSCDFLSNKVINVSSHDKYMYIDIEDSDKTRDILVKTVLEDGLLKDYIDYYGPKSGVSKRDLVPTIKLLLSRIRGEP